jgi:hypothetical protein
VVLLLPQGELLPLLGGEGRGEGERSSQLNCSGLVLLALKLIVRNPFPPD